MKNDKFSRDILLKICEILLIALIVAISLIMLVSVSYTYICEDDFSWLGGVRDIIEEYGGNKLTASLRGAYGYCFSNEGSFFANFLLYFLNPYVRFGLQGFHLVMIMFLLGYILSAFYLISGIFEQRIVQLIFTLVIMTSTFCLYCTDGVRELFLWYTGACNYTVQLSLSFLALAIVVRGIKKGNLKISQIIIASVAGFLGSGGKVIISAVNCSWLLVAIILCWNRFMKNKKFFIPFGFSFVGAILNVICPGNYTRADSCATEGHSTVFDALRDTFELIINNGKSSFHSKLFILGLITVFITIILFKNTYKDLTVKGIQVLLTWLGSFVILYASMFPIALGAHTSSLDSMRLQQIFIMILTYMCIFSITITGLWIRALNIKATNYVVCIATILCLCVILIPSKNKDFYSDVQKGFTSCVLRDVKNNRLRDDYMMRCYILESLDLADEDSDVVLFMPYYGCESNYGMGINEDPNSFVNTTVKNWKRINSLTVYYLGLTYPIS